MLRRAVGAAAVALTAAAGLLTPSTLPADADSPAATTSAPTWAPASQATIHPGVQTRSPSGQCTANFVFYDGTDIYLGSAAHCTSLGGSTDTNGCRTGSLPIGTPVEVDGARHPAKLFYNSWLTMQDRGERDGNACAYNDFALLVLDRRDHGRVNPTVPTLGGPTGVGGPLGYGQRVYGHGNSSLRLGVPVLQPKVGTSLGETGSGWAHRVTFATPGIPGDSGGAVLDAAGRATGVFSTLVVIPVPGSNHATDVAKALDYLHRHTGVTVTLATAADGFTP